MQHLELERTIRFESLTQDWLDLETRQVLGHPFRSKPVFALQWEGQHRLEGGSPEEYCVLRGFSFETFPVETASDRFHLCRL
jgi:hypothetical protein